MYSIAKPARWQRRQPKVEFNVVHRWRIKNQSADTSLRLDTAGADTTELEIDSPQMIGSLVNQGGDKINDGHAGNSDLIMNLSTV